MYLKSIKAVGFKSFANKVIIDFNKDITAVVGPNGSGKSNIVDAIRWVLGEQSVRQLRGSEIMSDVIFSGSDSRDALKKASVILTFDNSDKYLNSDFEEIEVKREVYKTGENEYYINNSKVRLKDIRDLFLDTGAGIGSFNIISQGNITEIVNSKPNDRRIIFESAAGVLKYKNRKEESLKKLEKTKVNLDSIKLVIDELYNTVKPLKKQSDDAKVFLEQKKSLEKIEIALLATEIEDNNNLLENIKNEINIINRNIGEQNSSLCSAKLESLRLEVIKIDDDISMNNNQIILINDEISKLSSEKQIMIERQRYSTSSINVNDTLLSLKEEEAEYLKKKSVYDKEIGKLNKNILDLKANIEDSNNDLVSLKIKRSSLDLDIDNQNKLILNLDNKLEIANNNIRNQEFYPKAVKMILNNSNISNVHNTIGNLIKVSLKYKTAIDISLGSSINSIVTEGFATSKECINYLKNQKAGRATFYSLDIIKGRHLKKELINDLSKIPEFIGVASDLIEYDSRYKDIVEYLLGNVLVVENIEALDEVGKASNMKYKVVSLDGEILYAGGAVSGGSIANSNDKSVIKKLQKELKFQKNILSDMIYEFDKASVEYHKNDEKLDLLNKKLILLNESLNNKELSLKEVLYNLDNKSFEIKGLANIGSNKVEEELIYLIETLTEKAKGKMLIDSQLEDLKDKKSDLFDEIFTLENEIKHKSSETSKMNAMLRNSEVEVGRLETKLDNYLNILSRDYNITYDYAKENYFLDTEKEEAKGNVKKIKANLSNLKDVNLGSISEYARVNERYEFLKAQEKDLLDASKNLRNIIDEMDHIMIEKFEKSFIEVSTKFNAVFKELFQGGRGELVLTDPSNLLTTGIEIIAEPPGKKLNSTIALSGGEKSLTALTLLFSILKVRPVPFIILDEAEAALDETNVDMFGKYINNMKSESQFILITHKKRMMEYADSLYGITMQESGVSKLVSTKLEA